MRDLLAERADTLAHARRIVDGAKAAGDRDLTEYEEQQVQTDLETVRLLDRQIQGRSMVNKVKGLYRDEDWTGDGSPKPQLFDDRAREGFLHAIKSKSIYRATIDRAGMQTKATILEGSLVPPAGDVVAPPLYPNISIPPLTDLMRTVAVGVPTVRFYRVGAGVASVTAEGATKPDSGISATAVDVPLTKIAATLSLSDELSDDAPFLLAQFQQALVNAVVSAENTGVITALSGTSGILATPGAAASIIDLLADAIAGMQAVGTQPSAILVNPSTLATIRKAKASGSGEYLAVDPLAAGPTSVHGLPCYAVNATGANTAWVIDGTGLTYFRRNEVTFELGWANDDWVRNVRTARAETRGICAVLQPLAVTKVGPLT
jgi:HK97 family phage major capsid protein